MVDINQAKEKIFSHNRANPYVDITPYELQVGFPVVNYSGFFPQVDEVILYAVPAATFKDKEQVVSYTGTDMTIDKAVDLLTDYLPAGFGEYYSQDCCYKYSGNAIDIYTYSCRLNEAGTEYHNNGHDELSYYYYLRFTHYTETNQWKLETGYAPYGDKGVDWIENYAEPWEIDMSSYLN